MLSQIWQESYRDLVIENNINNYKLASNKTCINKIITNIKNELKKNDQNIKTHALMKLLFLKLHNHDIKWASINTLEVISTCGNFGKKIGYIVGQYQFKNNSDFLQLTPNLILKELLAKHDSTSIALILNFLASLLLNNNCYLFYTLTSHLELLLNKDDDKIRKKLFIILTKMHLSTNDESIIERYLLSLSKFLDAASQLSNGVIISIISSIQIISYSYPAKVKIIFFTLWHFFKSCKINWVLLKLIDIFIRISLIDLKIFKSAEIVNYFGKMLKMPELSKSVEAQLTRLLILNINPRSFPELFSKCEEHLKGLINYNDINLVLIALRILKNLFKLENKSYLSDKTYITQIFDIVEKGQKERIKELYYYNKKHNIISNENTNIILKKREILNKAFPKNIYDECLEIISLSVESTNFKNICNKLLNLIGIKKKDFILDNYNQININKDLMLDQNNEENEEFMDTANINNFYYVVDKHNTINTFINIVSFDKYSLLEEDLENFNWLIDKLFDIVEDGLKHNYNINNTNYILRDISFRVVSLRENIVTNCLNLVFKIFKNKDINNNNTINFQISNTNLKYYPYNADLELTLYDNKNDNKSSNKMLLETLLYLIGEYYETSYNEIEILLKEKNYDLKNNKIDKISVHFILIEELLFYMSDTDLNYIYSSLFSCIIKIIFKLAASLENKDDFLTIFKLVNTLSINNNNILNNSSKTKQTTDEVIFNKVLIDYIMNINKENLTEINNIKSNYSSLVKDLNKVNINIKMLNNNVEDNNCLFGNVLIDKNEMKFNSNKISKNSDISISNNNKNIILDENKTALKNSEKKKIEIDKSDY